MSNIFSRSVFINFNQIIAVVSLISLFNLSFFNPALVSNANAQSAEQKALAERFGISFVIGHVFLLRGKLTVVF